MVSAFVEHESRPRCPQQVKKEYRAIDVKLCLALMSMLKTTGDAARVIRIEVEKLQRHRAKHDKMLSGREVIAIIFENFRSNDNADVIFMIDNLIRMKYLVTRRSLTSTPSGILCWKECGLKISFLRGPLGTSFTRRSGILQS